MRKFLLIALALLLAPKAVAATTYYASSSVSAPITPGSVHSSWNRKSSGFLVRAAVKSDASSNSTWSDSFVSGTQSTAGGQFIYGPIGAQTISGTVTATIRGAASYYSNIYVARTAVWIATPTGSLRATCLSGTDDSSNWSTSLTNYTLSSHSVSCTATNGDYLVMEGGWDDTTYLDSDAGKVGAGGSNMKWAFSQTINDALTATQLVFTTQPSTPDASGNVFTTQPAVSVENAGNNVVTTPNYSITLAAYSASNCTGSVSTLGVTTNPLTSSSGVATFSGVEFTNATPQTIYLGASTSGLTSACSNAVVIQSGSEYQLAYTTPPASTATSGSAMTSFAVSVQNSSSTTINSATDSITISAYTDAGCSSAASGTISGTNPVSANGTSGTATFSNVIYTGSPATIYLKAASGSLTSACSSAITVASGTATKVAFTTEPSATGTALYALATQPAVTIENSSSTAVDVALPVTLALYINSACTVPATAILYANSNPVTSAAGTGIATFAGVSISAAGTFYIGASSPGLTSACSTPATVISARSGTTIYLPSSSYIPAPILPTKATTWTGTVPSSHNWILASTTPTNTANTLFVDTNTETSSDYYAAAQYIIPFNGANTVSGTVSFAGFGVSTSGNTLTCRVGIRVIEANGTTVRGTPLAPTACASTFNTTGQSEYINGSTLTSVSAAAGDFLEVTVGWSAGSSAASATGGVYLGNTANSNYIYTASNTQAALNPTVNFSATLNFYTPQILYLPSTSATPPITPAVSTSWTGTSASFHRYFTSFVPTNTLNTQFSLAETSQTNTFFVMNQYISCPLHAQTIAGWVNSAIESETSTAGICYYKPVIMVYSGNGTTLRGTLINGVTAGYPGFNAGNPSPWSVWMAGNSGSSSVPEAMTSVVASEGDVLVIDIGFEWSGTSVSSTCSYWGDDSESSLYQVLEDSVTRNGYIELLGNPPITFQ